MKLPRAYEVMDLVLRHGDAVELERLLSCSPKIIRAWCREPETEDDFLYRQVRAARPAAYHHRHDQGG